MSLPPIRKESPQLIKEPDDIKTIEIDDEIPLEEQTLYYQDVSTLQQKTTDEKIKEHVKELERFFKVEPKDNK